MRGMLAGVSSLTRSKKEKDGSKGQWNPEKVSFLVKVGGRATFLTNSGYFAAMKQSTASMTGSESRQFNAALYATRAT